MKFKALFFLFLASNSFFLFPQSATYFIKYKPNVEREEVASKVAEQKLFPASQLNKESGINYSVDYLAKGLAKNIEELSKIIKVTFDEEADAANFISELESSDPSIEYIQPAVAYKIEFIPNDSLLSEQWSLDKIKAFDAWEITQGADSIIVGIIDTGIDYLHLDLKDKIYFNKDEIGLDANGNDKRSNGIDDDGNGFIDDYMGWDFTDRLGFPFDSTGGDYLNWDNDPKDDNGHGTFVTGIVGAETNNRIGVAGVAPNTKILNIRAFDPGGIGEEDDVAAAIIYAVQMGAKIINMSFGDYTFSFILRDIIRYAYSQNIIMVGSSGNSNTAALHYPSGFPEVISVGNSTQDDFLTGSYGSTLDLVAPGTSILSTGLNEDYIVSGGTSASAPHVTATAALILSINNFTNEEVKQIIKSTADDIGEPGWDIRSGSGRLNVFKALSILAPAKVKINYPSQDFTTFQDTINFNITVMSPYFLKYRFEYGFGLNPEQWIQLISDGRNQVINEDIFSLNLSSLQEGAYTARLVMEMNNGSTMEERINFFIQRTASKVELVGIGPVYYGNVSTILAEVFTDQRANVRLYYRVKGMSNFDFITLDGFNTNNQFVKQLHYGFIPKQIIRQNTLYELYLEAINLADSVTIIMDAGNTYFEFITDNYPNLIPYTELPFSLPKGTIFGKPVNFLSNSFNEILFNEFYVKPDSINVSYSLYQYSNDSLIKKDSVINKIPIEIGDFNNNGKTDLLSLLYPFSYIDEQVEPFTFNLETKLITSFSNDTSFYPMITMDLDNDNRTEVLSNYFDSISVVWRINDDLSISPIDSLINYSFVDSADNLIGSEVNTISRNAAAVADLNGDGINEIWFADYDGDLISFKATGAGNFERGDSLITKLFTNKNNILSSGDFDGDGVEELAVLFETNGIAPNFYLLVLNFKNNSPNILFEKIFLDQSAEFLGFGFNEVYQTVEFADIDEDGKSELILNIFPYLYIFKHNQTETKLVYYQEGVNSEDIFSGDINQNGVTEIAFQTAEGIRFYEFGVSNKPNTPSSLAGYSMDSTLIRLEWRGSSAKYYIYRGEEEDNLFLYDSSSTLFYLDISVQNQKNYFYKIQAFDNNKEIPYSNFTNILNVFSHLPGRVISAVSSSSSTVLVTFTEKMNNTIENLGSFEVTDHGIPNSVSPANQYAYLLTFRETLPSGEHKLIVKKLKDFYGSLIETDTAAFIINSIEVPTEFFITSHEIINPYLIKVVFNFEVDEASASNINNYIFEPENKAARIDVDANDKKIILIHLDKKNPVGSIGREYKLRIVNLLSSPLTGSLKINSGAGSYIVLTGFAMNLSDVYVYPSPAKINNGEGKITFANLPQKAKITIFNLNGEQIFNLEENDGNGGVDFNLQKETGEKLNSGVYFYRIVRLDNSDNEIEEKIGKFAVIN